MKLTRKNYMADKITHQDYYENIAKELGICVIRDNVFPGYSLKEAFKADKNLNNIPLRLWDQWANSLVLYDVHKIKQEIDPCFGSLSDLVCMLKAAAIKFVESK